MTNPSPRGPLASVLKRSPRLTPAQERDLVRRAQAGDERARQAMVEGNLRLVFYVARRYQSSSLSLEDMVQDGVVGLCDALDRYDASTGHSFSSYAVPWIRLRIGRSVYRMSRLIRLPERNERLLARWNQLCDRHNDRQVPPPTVEEGARTLGVTAETLRAVLEAAQPIGTLHPVDADGDAHAAEEYVPVDPAADPWEKLVRAEEWERVESALRELRPSYRQVLEQSYGLHGDAPRTLNDIAREWGVTKQAVSGLRKRALASLRERIAERHGSEPS